MTLSYNKHYFFYFYFRTSHVSAYGTSLVQYPTVSGGFNMILIIINPFFMGNPKTGIFTNSEDPDEMPRNVAFH